MAAYGIFGHALNIQKDGSVTGESPPPQAPGLGYWLALEEGNVGKAVRGYNTGRVPDGEDLMETWGIGTKRYVSDVGNRLTGGMAGGTKRYRC